MSLTVRYVSSGGGHSLEAIWQAVLSQSAIRTDEMPLQMLAPSENKLHRAYVWAFRCMAHPI